MGAVPESVPAAGLVPIEVTTVDATTLLDLGSQLETGETLTTEERAELASLRKDNRELRMKRDILKKAAAFFAKHQA